MSTLTNASRLILGTAQFGLDYGISNDLGRVSERAAFDILDRAGAVGIRLLDTAPAYGNAEDLLSRYRRRPGASPFRIISKVSLKSLAPEIVLDRVRRNIDRLGGRIEAVLVHAPQELSTKPGEQLWKGLLDLRDAHACRRVGISAYIEDGPVLLARRFQPDLMQVPLSVIDQRLLNDGSINELAALKVAVHVRSIFLQGALLTDPSRLPETIASIRPHLNYIRAYLQAVGLTPLHAALQFPIALASVQAVVIGVTRLTELDDIIKALVAEFTPQDFNWRALALEDTNLLDPRRW